jgi:acyl-CoA thioester hydrolase
MIDLEKDIANARLAHTMTIPMRWGDMDVMGHLNNAMYLRLMEESRLHWYKDSRVGMGRPGQAVGSVMVSTYVEFIKPIVWPASVQAKLFLGAPGRSSFMSYHELRVNDEVCSRAAVKIVAIDLKTGKSVPLPDDVRALMAAA